MSCGKGERYRSVNCPAGDMYEEECNKRAEKPNVVEECDIPCAGRFIYLLLVTPAETEFVRYFKLHVAERLTSYCQIFLSTCQYMHMYVHVSA